MLILETQTELRSEDVVRRAREFFATRLSPATAFVMDGDDTFVRFHTEAGVLTIGVARRGERNVVRGSTSRLHHALSQFLATLNHPEEVRQNLLGVHPAPAALEAGDGGGT